MGRHRRRLKCTQWEQMCLHQSPNADGPDFRSHYLQQSRHCCRHKTSSCWRAKVLQQAEKKISLPYDHSAGQTEVKLCLDLPQVPSVGLHYHCQRFCCRETAVRQSFPLVLDEGEKEALLGVSSAAVPLLTTAGGLLCMCLLSFVEGPRWGSCCCLTAASRSGAGQHQQLTQRGPFPEVPRLAQEEISGSLSQPVPLKQDVKSRGKKHNMISARSKKA